MYSGLDLPNHKYLALVEVCIPRSPCHYRATDRWRSQGQPELSVSNAHKDGIPVHLPQNADTDTMCFCLGAWSHQSHTEILQSC